MSRRRRHEDGVATVWALALVSCLGLVAIVMSGVGSLAAARERAATVADLAANAAVQSDDGCSAASRVGFGNDARVVGCQYDGTDAVVTVELDAPSLAVRMATLLGHAPPTVTATSRAGPPTS